MNSPRPNESQIIGVRRLGEGKCVSAVTGLVTAVLAMGAAAPAGLPDPFSAPATPGAKINAIVAETDAEGYHTFTDAKGNTFKARVLGLVKTTVTLQRADGDKVQAALSSFSKSDQDYIVQSILKLNAARGQKVFDFSAVTEKSNPVTSKIEGGARVNWQENYRITLKNNTLLTMGNLQARIILFKAQQVPDVPGGSMSPITLLTQTQNVVAIPGSGKGTIQTDPVPMEQILANDGGYFPKELGVHMKTDKFMAVWLRIYNGDKVVQEWCSQPDLTKQQTWDAAWALAGGKAAGRF